MRRTFVTMLLVLFASVSITAQKAVYTREYSDKGLRKEARRWARKGLWRQGFAEAGPDKTVNLTEFYEQYRKNTAQWEALFRWLASTDLRALPKGKHPIEGTTLVASVEDSENGPLARRRSESHRDHIDFQWVVSGTERFGLLDHLTSTPNTEWRPDVIHYDYDKERTMFVDSRPDRFFIFFPSDWHIAKVATDLPDQHIRVVVVKVDYIH